MSMFDLGTIGAAQGVNFKALNLPEPTNPKEAQKLWQASQAMESIFAQYMLSEIDNMMPQSSANSANVYGDILKQVVADTIAESNSLGMSRQLYLAVEEMEKNTVKIQETGTNPASNKTEEATHEQAS